MATELPRFQPMGVQFADLPRVSTASQEVGAQMQSIKAQQFDQVGRAVDRMTAFFQEKAVTEAQKQGLRYAAENPLTKEQIDVALGTGQGLKVKGAGTIFQETYEQAQGQMLSSELQVQGQRNISALASRIKAGEQVDLGDVQTQLKDMIDGYSSTVMALDPKEAVRLRASLATAGSALYKEASDRSLLIAREQKEAQLNQIISESGALIETVLGKAGTIDPQTQKPVDVDKILEVLRKPFYDAIRITGNSKHIDDFNKKIEEAKVGVLTAAAMSPDFAPNVSASMGKIAKGDFGSLTSVYNSLSNDQKLKVIGNAKTFFANMEETRRIDEANRKEAERQEGNLLSIEFLKRNTTQKRKQEIVGRMVMIDEMTLPQAQEALKPKATEANPRLEVDLYQQIKTGRITRLGQLSSYVGQLSNSQYESLGRSIVDIQHRNAVEQLSLAAGITDNMFNPGQDKINQKAGYIKEFQRLMAGVKDKTGVVIQLDPAEAATKAIKNYESNEEKIKRDKKRETAANNLKDLLGARMPTGLNIEQIDINTIQGLNKDTKIRAREFIDEYRKNITPKPTDE